MNERLPSPFYDSLEEYMNDADRRLLDELKIILIGKRGTAVEGIAGAIAKIEEHLRNINGTVAEQEVKIERNRDRIATQWKIGGWAAGLFSAGLIAVLLKILELF